MSYCEIWSFKYGRPVEAAEFKNAWGGSAYIWTMLYDKYLKDPAIEYDTWLGSFGKDNGKSLWGLAQRDDLPLYERAIHSSTFDYAIIRREHFVEFCGHLREFVDHFSPKGNISCHLPAWASHIEALGDDVQAIGFRGTSVSENLWMPWDETLDESKPYDLSAADSRHFEVYEWLRE